jgi:hypothetical protein
MLVIKIELWPFGDASRCRLIDEVRVWNTGGPDAACRYIVQYGSHKAAIRHDRSRGAMALVARALAKLLRTMDAERGE